MINNFIFYLLALYLSPPLRTTNEIVFSVCVCVCVRVCVCVCVCVYKCRTWKGGTRYMPQASSLLFRKQLVMRHTILHLISGLGFSLDLVQKKQDNRKV